MQSELGGLFLQGQSSRRIRGSTERSSEQITSEGKAGEQPVPKLGGGAVASLSLCGFKLPFCRRCLTKQEPSDPTHHTPSPERLRRSGEAACSPFDLQSGDAMNFTQRSSPLRLGGRASI